MTESYVCAKRAHPLVEQTKPPRDVADAARDSAVRLEPDRLCMLVIMDTRENGTKELIAIYDGVHESKELWLVILRDLKSRGLADPPSLRSGMGRPL